MEESASKFADRIAVSMYEGEKLTYDQINKKVKSINIHFQEEGMNLKILQRIPVFNKIHCSVIFYLSKLLQIIIVIIERVNRVLQK